MPQRLAKYIKVIIGVFVLNVLCVMSLLAYPYIVSLFVGYSVAEPELLWEMTLGIANYPIHEGVGMPRSLVSLGVVGYAIWFLLIGTLQWGFVAIAAMFVMERTRCREP